MVPGTGLASEWVFAIARSCIGHVVLADVTTESATARPLHVAVSPVRCRANPASHSCRKRSSLLLPSGLSRQYLRHQHDKYRFDQRLAI